MLASSLQSCQTQVEIPDGAIYPILFGSTETRAVANLDNLKSNGFKVYAYFEGNQGSASFANNVQHAVVKGLDVWSFTTPEYWIPDTKYWFKAFYPTELPEGTLTVNQDTSAQNFTIKGFDIVNHQVDIMVAEATASVDDGATAPESGSVVNLTFQHLLACIEVQMKSAISNVSITKITLENADNNATYKDGTWTADGSGEIEIAPTDGSLSSTVYKSVTNDGILVIPGSSSGKSFYIETNINKTYRVNIPEITWVKGNKYTYTAEIKQNNIIFNEPNVDEWDSENATGSVIIK